MTVCRDASMSAFFRRASLPQRMNTTGSVFAAMTRITSSVNVSTLRGGASVAPLRAPSTSR